MKYKNCKTTSIQKIRNKFQEQIRETFHFRSKSSTF